MKYLLYYNTKHDFDADKGKDSDSLSYVEDVDSCYFNVPKQNPYVKLTFADGTTRKDEYEDGVISLATSPYSGDTSIIDVEISSGITSITTSKLFRGCTSLESATVNANITGLPSDIFNTCSALTSCSLSTSINNMIGNCFYNCYNLKSINLENIKKINSTNFQACSSLTNVKLDSIDYIGFCSFSKCTSLSSVTLGTSLATFGSFVFSGDTSLTEIKYNGTTTEWINKVSRGARWADDVAATKIQCTDGCVSVATNAVVGCEDPYVKLTFADGTTRTDEYANGVISGASPYSGNTSITAVEISNGITHITTEMLFAMCSNLSSVTFNANVISILFGTFGACSSLTSCTLSSSITNIGQSAFAQCSSLEEINLEHITNFGEDSFSECKSLDTVNFNSNVTFGQTSFQECSSITSVTLDKVTFSGNEVFYLCTGLKTLTIQDAEAIGVQAFSHCTALTSVTLPSNLTEIKLYAFAACTNLAEIKFNGTKAQWNAVTKDSHWADDVAATVVQCTDGDVNI